MNKFSFQLCREEKHIKFKPAVFFGIQNIRLQGGMSMSDRQIVRRHGGNFMNLKISIPRSGRESGLRESVCVCGGECTCAHACVYVCWGIHVIEDL